MGALRAAFCRPFPGAKPGALVDGHPESSKLILFEGFVKKDRRRSHREPSLGEKHRYLGDLPTKAAATTTPAMCNSSDFFGDGTRIPMIVVSRFSQGGHISHSYADHVSTLKFIEANWGVSPITTRSRDNFPNPISTAADPYVPTNRPAIGDLMDMFNFQNAQ